MKVLILAFLALVCIASTGKNDKEENVRYILIEAACKPGFDALNDYNEKVILSKVFKKEFENAFDIVNAEPKLIIDFEVALEKAYPNQRNQIKDILVYMLNTEKEAKELHNRKRKLFDTLDKGVIELKVE